MEWRRRRTIRRALSRLPMLQPELAVLPPGVTIGRHTFGHGIDTFQLFRPGSSIEVGAFCSIQREARILAGSEHFTERVSTFPFNARLFEPKGGNLKEAIATPPTVIGNDVWIGMGAIILSGVLVGDGAVIGAGAVVSKPVPPYAVVAGNPAQIVRHRFDADVCRRLLALRWWEWSEESLAKNRAWFEVDVERFLVEMEQIHEPQPPTELARRLSELAPDELTPERTTTAR